jgi:hypothetical protein
MGLKQRTKQLLVLGASHLAKLQGTQFAERRAKRRLVHDYATRPTALEHVVRGAATHRRQLDKSGPLELQHQAAAHHVAKRFVGLYLIPRFAQLRL